MKTIKNLTADQLRKSILQLAIEGKLVKQNPNDEPASELVKKIMAEKKKLIQEGKIKKDKNESYIFKGDDNFYYEKIGNNTPVKLEDLPFDIPDSWTWIRLNSFANIYNGNSINETEKIRKYTNVKGRSFIATKDVLFNRTIDYENGVKIPENETKFRIAPANKILLCIEGGSAGRKIAFTNKEVCFGNKLACFNTFTINDLYLYNILQTATFLELFKSSLTGIIGGVSINTLKRFLVPLPPLEEQQRIVDKICFIEPLLEKYDSIEKKLSGLEAEFPEKLKKSILQYAIEGKLVKQDPNDEPASVLLECIKAEKERLIKEGKIKRDKNESYIYQGDDKNYYEKIFYGLPENWVKLNVLGTLLPMESTKPNCDFQYIDIDSIDNINHMIVRSKATKLEKAPSRATRKLKAGDILFSLVRPYLENVAIVYPNYANCIGSTGFYVCRPRSYIKTEFLFYYLITPYFINGVMKFIKGDNSPSIRNYAIESMLIGLPSLNEQERIVHKIKNLFAQIKQ